MSHHIIVLICALWVYAACASEDEAVEKKEVPQKEASPVQMSFEQDGKGEMRHIDFSLPINSLSHPDMIFSHLANRKLVVFYFSAKCIHCQKAFPHIQALANRLQPQGVSFVGIAVKNNTEEDVRDFIRTYQCNFPVFHDFERNFSSTYGSGSIPLVMYVNESGEYMRFAHFDAQQTPEHIVTLANH